MSDVRLLTVLVLAALISLAPLPSAAQAPALLGGLDAGPHAVGFRVIPLKDPSRPVGPKVDAGGRPVAGDRARDLALHVWYPAAAAGRSAMTMADYISAAGPGGTPSGGGPAAEHRAQFPRTFGLTLSDEEWGRYNGVTFTAQRDAPPAAGRFPLLIGMLRPVSVVAMSEYLASHGYAVAFVRAPQREQLLAEGLVREALIMSQHVRDMEIAIAALRELPFVHPAALGALGFSGDGLAPLVLAMRHPDVDAVSQLETGYFAPIGTSSYQEMKAYDPAVLRVPMFFAYSENLGRHTDMQMAEIERMRYAPRHLFYLGEPRMSHWDFATEGIVLAAALDRRPDARAGVIRAFEAAQRQQRTFFDAFVKRDAPARERLKTAPVPSGPGPMIEVRELAAVVPAIGRGDFRALLDRDIAAAMQQAREGLTRDPRAAVFEEPWLNALGYEMLQRGQADKAVQILTLTVEAYPSSANAYDSLSEVLEAVGQRAAAAEWAGKGLAALPGDTALPPPQRKTLEDGLRARVERLKGK